MNIEWQRIRISFFFFTRHLTPCYRFVNDPVVSLDIKKDLPAGVP